MCTLAPSPPHPGEVATCNAFFAPSSAKMARSSWSSPKSCPTVMPFLRRSSASAGRSAPYLAGSVGSGEGAHFKVDGMWSYVRLCRNGNLNVDQDEESRADAGSVTPKVQSKRCYSAGRVRVLGGWTPLLIACTARNTPGHLSSLDASLTHVVLRGAPKVCCSARHPVVA